MKQEKLEELASKTAKKVLAGKKGIEPTFEDILEDDDATFNFGSLDIKDIEEMVEFDIFQYCEDEYVKKGDYVEYTIKKNGATVGFKKHPYSWEKIQKEFGGGRYNVLAKSTATGRIVKRQTMAMEDSLENEGRKGYDGFNPADLVQQIAEVVKPQNEGPNFMELFALMSNQQEKAREEANRAAEQAKRESASQTTTLVNLMQQNTMMMLEMMKSSQKGNSTYELAQIVQSFAEKMENRFERAIEKLDTKKSPEFGLVDILRLQQDAQEKGFKMYAQLNTIAEAKANEKIELIEEYKVGGGTPEKKSMTDTLIETMLPTIAGALANQGKGATPPTQANQIRRPVRQVPVQNSVGQRNSQTQTQTANQGQKTAIQSTSQSVGKTSGPGIGKSGKVTNSVGLPKPKFAKKVESSISVVEQVISQPIQVVDYETEIKLFRERASEIIVPVLAEHLIQKTPTDQSALIAETALLDNGISREEFLEKFPVSVILDLVKDFGLDEEAYKWIEDTYANLATKSCVTVGEYSVNAN